MIVVHLFQLQPEHWCKNKILQLLKMLVVYITANGEQTGYQLVITKKLAVLCVYVYVMH